MGILTDKSIKQAIIFRFCRIIAEGRKVITLCIIREKKSLAGKYTARQVLFFGEMDVGEDMVLAEAMVTGAFAAVTEIQIRVIRIGFAADGALVDIALFLLCLVHRLFEVDGLAAVLIAASLRQMVHLRIDEHGEIQKGYDGLYHAVPAAAHSIGDHVVANQNSVRDSQPFHLDGNDEEQQYLCIGEQAGKGKEHGEVDIVRTADDQVDAADQAGHGHGDDRQQYAAEIVEVEFGSTPLPLQRAANPIVEVQLDEKHERPGGVGNENKADDTPHFSAEQSVQVKVQKVQGGDIGQKHSKKIDGGSTDDDVAHQVGDTETGVPGAEAIHGVIEFFQGKILLLNL